MDYTQNYDKTKIDTSSLYLVQGLLVDRVFDAIRPTRMEVFLVGRNRQAEHPLLLTSLLLKYAAA